MENHMFYALASGQLYFTGLALILLSIGIKLLSQGRIADLMQMLCLALGTVSIVFSIAPIPFYMYCMSALILVFHIILNSLSRFRSCRIKRKAVSIILLFTITGIGIMELPYFIQPEINISDHNLYILGDSLTAGTRDQHIIRYPELLEKRLNLKITDLSIPGSRAEDGLKMLKKIPDHSKPVLLELGVNDWRRKRDNQEELYTEGLDSLLKELTSTDRQVIMFEMPFPSYEPAFIYTQRKLTRKYRITMIPRKFIAEVMFKGEGLTIDGIHLSAKGHLRFAEKLKAILRVQEKSRSFSP